MVKAIDARNQGDDYQSRVFWLQACRLFLPHTKVAKVGYDIEDLKHFDDVAVIYSCPIPDGRGGSVEADYYQVKYHVDQAGAFTCDSLMDGSFIRASTSILQRLSELSKLPELAGKGYRFHIVSPRQIDPSDTLSKLVGNKEDGELRLEILFDGKTDKSRMGEVRSRWREHLCIGDEELRKVIAPLRLLTQAGSLCSMRDVLNDKLVLAGLQPVDADHVGNPYDDLIQKLHADGKRYFTRSELQNICETEGLWKGGVEQMHESYDLGIRSFSRWAEQMEDETDQMLCLLKHFDNRHIKRSELWEEAILPEVQAFLHHNIAGGASYHLHIDAHSSIAFAAGYCLDPKSAADVALLQKGLHGKVLWKVPAVPAQADEAPWLIDEIKMADDTEDAVVAVSISHNVLPDVGEYVERALPHVGRILGFTPRPGPGPSAVRDGAHASSLARALASEMKTRRTTAERHGRLHVFIAAPNGFTFFLGQLARSFGSCTLYEYDFESNAPGAYEPSVSFPVVSLLEL